jgi:hypothetical protein
LTSLDESGPIPAVKFAASLLLLCFFTCVFTGCTTDVDRRDLYSPTKGSGYWTKREQQKSAQEGIFGISKPDHYH